MHRYTQLPTSNTVGLIFTRVVDEGRYCCYLAAIHNACRPCVTVPIAQPGVVVASIIMPASPCSLQHKYALHHTYTCRPISNPFGDAENARHEIAGHENAAPCCSGGKCET